MADKNSYSKIDQPAPFKQDDIVMDMVGTKLRFSHTQTNNICICTYLEGDKRGKTWYGVQQQLAYYNAKIQLQLSTLTKDIEIAEQNAQSLYSSRNKLWQTVRIK
jgi:hypothetical protein